MELVVKPVPGGAIILRVIVGAVKTGVPSPLQQGRALPVDEVALPAYLIRLLIPEVPLDLRPAQGEGPGVVPLGSMTHRSSVST